MTILLLHFRILVHFIEALYNTYVEQYFTYLEINPLGECPP